MATIDFPTSPINGQTYTFGQRTWQYNGSAWQAIGYISTATSVDIISPFLLMGA